MQISLTEEEFVEFAARYSVVPLSAEVLADSLTPVTVFERLVGTGDGFLLESVEGGEGGGRWALVGWAAALTVTARGGETTCDEPSFTLVGTDPLEVLEDLIDRFTIPPLDELGFRGPVPPLHSGAVGFLSYDIVRYIERLEHQPPDDRGLPEMLWQFVGALAAFDRLRETITLIVNVFVGDDAHEDYRRATGTPDAAKAQAGAPAFLAGIDRESEVGTKTER